MEALEPLNISLLQEWLAAKNAKAIKSAMQELHPADAAELFVDLNIEQQTFVYGILDNDFSASLLLDLDEEDRRELLQNLSAEKIATEIVDEMDSDDATDVISELSDQKKREVISALDDKEYAQDLLDLLRHDDHSAGGLMGKELVKVNKNWNLINAVKAMRRQAEELEEVHSIYVVDDEDHLLGTLSLKKLLTSSAQEKVENLYNKKVYSVLVSDDAEKVGQFMQKYDLYEAPVVDELDRLIGKVTVDDVLDVIREEAEKDYQLASGITEDVDLEDSLLRLTKARLPWLTIGVFGGIMSSWILRTNEEAMRVVPMLILFIPLIAATAGNVGVQSSAIIVQALANGTMKKTLWKTLTKEISLAVISGIALSLMILLYNVITSQEMSDWLLASLTISIALFIVVLVSASIGTIVPLILEKRGIDPALATGPFITTSNDLLGIIIYFLIAKLILGI